MMRTFVHIKGRKENLMANNDNFIVTCPVCGQRFGQSKSGTFTKMSCPKCKSEIQCSIKGNAVTTIVLERSTKTKKAV